MCSEEWIGTGFQVKRGDYIPMPKKFVGENSKAAAAKARKSAAKDQQDTKRQQQIEDELWKDDDKQILKKQQKKVENEKRQLASVCKVKEPVTHIEKPLEENINRIQVEGDEARSVEEAIAVLSVKDPDVDRHPEKRLKAAYTAFEEVNMPRIKSENPTLRLSQLKQILRKDWMKSPENPLNQRFSS
uniref:Coiled-coil domain-containing protein n=1 Tax=Timema genevievae TaxID=629358 RepID=A0A7R9K6N3_TIMGE|nr:unnamed protein product [Timema genevievae]